MQATFLFYDKLFSQMLFSNSWLEEKAIAAIILVIVTVNYSTRLFSTSQFSSVGVTVWRVLTVQIVCLFLSVHEGGFERWKMI